MKIIALAGGVGGAKLAHGLALALPPENLTVIVNTGDDFEHLGLYICPDLDTVCYTLAGLANPRTGWGRAGESWHAIADLERLGAPGWFRLGDRDLATHLERTRRLKAGQKLSQVIHDFCAAWGIPQTVLPMSDQAVPTFVDTVEHGELTFQDYFVRLRCEPRVKGFRFNGLETAAPAPGLIEAIREADAIVICPSNPWVSIAPILAIPGLSAAMADKTVVAVSPLIGGRAVKGPAAKMYSELGIQPSASAVAQHYRGIVKGFVIDRADSNTLEYHLDPGLHVFATNILMRNRSERRRLAKDVLNFTGKLI
jgi:LPPG:FO 2-phospho-L-lactate transferase